MVLRSLSPRATRQADGECQFTRVILSPDRFDSPTRRKQKVDSERSVVVSSLLPGADSRENPNRQIGNTSGIVSDQAAPLQQKTRRRTKKRSGQAGSATLVGQKSYERYWRDVPGKEKRGHALVVAWRQIRDDQAGIPAL